MVTIITVSPRSISQTTMKSLHATTLKTRKFVLAWFFYFLAVSFQKLSAQNMRRQNRREGIPAPALTHAAVAVAMRLRMSLIHPVSVRIALWSRVTATGRICIMPRRAGITLVPSVTVLGSLGTGVAQICQKITGSRPVHSVMHVAGTLLSLLAASQSERLLLMAPSSRLQLAATATLASSYALRSRAGETA